MKNKCWESQQPHRRITGSVGANTERPKQITRPLPWAIRSGLSNEFIRSPKIRVRASNLSHKVLEKHWACTLWKARYVTKSTSCISLESQYNVLWSRSFLFFLPYCHQYKGKIDTVFKAVFPAHFKSSVTAHPQHTSIQLQDWGTSLHAASSLLWFSS